MKHLLAVLAVTALALTACSKDKAAASSDKAQAAGPAFKASCLTPKMGTCTEYTDEAFVLGEELVKTGCTETKGTWSPAHCPADKKLGQCAMSGQTRVYYPGGDFDYSPDTAKKDCTELFEGKWVASR